MRHSIGWKAIIYDAPWAYFKDGQPGVIVTEDGKTCETTNDDLSSIIIVADENTLFEERTGKVKFIQNESGKDIDIDLVQIASKHVYELSVQDVTMNGCTATYDGFTEQVSVYWVVDGVREPATNYTIVTPESSDFNNVSGGKTLQIKITASRDGKTYSATSTCTITRAEDPITSYTNTVISGLSGTTIPCCMSTKGTCTLTASSYSIECEGTVNFSVINTKDTWPRYTVYLTGVTAEDNFEIEDCSGGTSAKTVDATDRMEFNVVEGESIVYNPLYDIEDGILTLNVKPNETFTIKATVRTTSGTSGATATTTINTSEANKHSQCTN